MNDQPTPPVIRTFNKRRTRVDMFIDLLKALTEAELVEAIARAKEYLKGYGEDRRRHWAGWLKKIRL